MKGLTSKILWLSLLVAGFTSFYYPHWQLTRVTNANGIEFDTVVSNHGLALREAQEHFIWGGIQVLEEWGYWDVLPSPVTVPFQYLGKHILVAVNLQPEHQPSPFIFDTGVRTPLINTPLVNQVPLLASFRINPQTLEQRRDD